MLSLHTVVYKNTPDADATLVSSRAFLTRDIQLVEYTRALLLLLLLLDISPQIVLISKVRYTLVKKQTQSLRFFS